MARPLFCGPLSLTDPTGYLAGSAPVSEVFTETELGETVEAVVWTNPELLVVLAPLLLSGDTPQRPHTPKPPTVAPTAPDPNRPDPANPNKPKVATPYEVKIDKGAIQSNGQGDKVSPTQSPNQDAKPGAPKPEPKNDNPKSSSDSKDSKEAASQKASSPGKMQLEVERGQAPREVDSVHRAHIDINQPHIHYKDGTSSNKDGTTHDKQGGTPNPSNKTIDWIKKHLWTPPPPPPPKPDKPDDPTKP